MHEGLPPWPARENASCECLRCSGEREIDIDVVAAFPAEEAAAADFLGSPMQHHLLSSRFRLTSKCPRTETINIPEPQP